MFGSKLRDGGYTGAACLAALRTPPIVSVICLDPSFTLKNVHLEFYFPKLCIWYRWCRGFIITWSTYFFKSHPRTLNNSVNHLITIFKNNIFAIFAKFRFNLFREKKQMQQFCGVKMRKKYGREIVNYDKIKILMLNLQSREFLLRNLLLQLQKKCLKILRNF